MSGCRCAPTPQASSLCITQVLKTISSEPILRSLPKPEQRKAMEERSARVKRLITDLCSAAIHTPGDEERVALRSEDVERATVVARAVFLIDRDLGLWLMEQEGVVSAICSLSFSSSATAQSLCASILSDLAGDEKGRSLINSEVCAPLVASLPLWLLCPLSAGVSVPLPACCVFPTVVALPLSAGYALTYAR